MRRVSSTWSWGGGGWSTTTTPWWAADSQERTWPAPPSPTGISPCSGECVHVLLLALLFFCESLCVNVCVCVCMCMCVCVCVCECTFAFFLCVYVQVYVCVGICMFTYCRLTRYIKSARPFFFISTNSKNWNNKVKKVNGLSFVTY